MADDWFDGSRSGGAVSCAEVLDAGALDGVVRLVGAGALVSLGLSRDGGALACTVTLDGRWRREWFSDGEGLGQYLADALDAVLRQNGGVIASSGPRGGSRLRKGRQKGL